MKEYFERYNFEVNETKWQDTWNKINAFKAEIDPALVFEELNSLDIRQSS